MEIKVWAAGAVGIIRVDGRDPNPAKAERDPYKFRLIRVVKGICKSEPALSILPSPFTDRPNLGIALLQALIDDVDGAEPGFPPMAARGISKPGIEKWKDCW